MTLVSAMNATKDSTPTSLVNLLAGTVLWVSMPRALASAAAHCASQEGMHLQLEILFAHHAIMEGLRTHRVFQHAICVTLVGRPKTKG